MGNLHGRPKQGDITEADRAVLSLRTQRTKLTGERRRLEAAVERELEVAKQLVAAKKKDRALLALKRRKIQEQQLTQLDAWLLNVEQLLSNIDAAKQQSRLFDALKAGSEAVKGLQRQVRVEDVEKLMEDNADAQAQQDRMAEALSQSLSAAEGEEAEAELVALEAEVLGTHTVEYLPAAPKHAVQVDGHEELPAVPTAARATEEPLVA